VTNPNQPDQDLDQSRELASEQTHSPGRRRLIQGASAAPVLLVSGRSALACNPDTDKCALSPMAWMSVHPKKKDVTVNLSHDVGCNFLGLSPGYWRPNCGGSAKTFQGPWPTGVKPFNQLKITKKSSAGKCLIGQYTTITWNPGNWNNYKGLPWIDPCTNKDVGWNTGSKLPFGSQTRSISQILLEDNGTVLWHICAAYLNALTWPTQYALTLQEVEQLYLYGKLVPGGRTLSSSEINAFLDQTWS
jgi:hypothetical protein